MSGVDDGDDLVWSPGPSWLASPVAIGKDEERLLLEVLLSADLAIWAADTVENNYAIRLWNPGAERTYGFTRQEAIGASYLDLFVNPDERARAIKDHARVIRAGEEFGWNFIAEDIKKDCTVLTILGNAFRIWDAANQRFIMAEVGLDISSFYRGHQQISRAKELSFLQDDARNELTVLRGLKIVDSAIAALGGPDSDGLVDIVSAIREALHGMLPSEPICRVWLVDDGETPRLLEAGSDDFPAPPTVQEASLVQEAIQKSGQASICTTEDKPALADPHTGKIYYSVVASPLQFGAETIAVLIMFLHERHFTKREQTVLQHFSNHAAIAVTMAKLTGDLQRRRREEAQQIKHAIIQSILHTVGNESGKTKLAVDSLINALGNNGSFDGRVQASVNVIKSSADRLGQIMDEIRRLGEEVNQPMRLRLLEALKVVTRVIECDHYQTIVVSHDVDPNLEVEVSEYIFREAFGNLVRNAVQAMKDADGGGDLRVSAVPIESRWNSQDRRVRIDIEDSGPGIRPEYRDKIWECGFSTRGEGHGYGLFHTRGLVTMINGSVLLLNEASDLGGAHFRMIVPMASSPD